MNLADGLSELALPFNNDDGAHQPILDLAGLEFCDPAATVVLAAFGSHFVRRTRSRVQLRGWQSDSYLARVGLKPLLGYEDDYPHTRRDDDRLTSLIEVADAKQRASARLNVLDVLDIQHRGSREVLDYCIEEVLRNVEDHADSPVNGLLQAQYYPNRQLVVVAIGDTGHGILWSLRQRSPSLRDDEEALSEALEPGVSGRNTRKGTNAGLGLTVSSSLVTKMGGTFQIASGDTLLEVTRRGRVAYKLKGMTWPGVLVTMSVPRDDSLDWEGTFSNVMRSL